MRRRILVAALTLVLPLASASLHAQQLTGVWVPSDPSDWNVNENWDLGGFPGVPNADTFGDHAQVSNGGTAIVGESVPNVADLTISDGIVQIGDGGSLSSITPDPDPGGSLTIGGSGVLALSGDGAYSAALDATNGGEISISGSNVTLDVGGGFTNNGAIVADIVGDDHSVISVGGVATLGGKLRPSFDATPEIGDSWTILQAASISGAPSLDLSNAPELPAGLLYDTSSGGGALNLLVRNSLVLTVDRESGATTLSNPIGAPIEFTGITLRSANALLNAESMASLGADWQGVSLAGATQAAQLNVVSSTMLEEGQNVSLGSAYLAGPQTPAEEDLIFEYVTGAGDVFSGVVEYTGAISDLVLNVDPDTGAAAISLLSPHFPASDIIGFTVESPGGSLLTDYATFENNEGVAGPGWAGVDASANHVGELNLENSFEYNTGDVTPLGTLFNVNGDQDLLFTYLLSSGEVRSGTVSYGDVPPPPDGCSIDWPGDANCDGTTDLADFNILKGNFNTSGGREEGDFNEDGQVDLADFNILKANFNTSAPVPEPSAWLLAGLATGGFVLLRRRAAA